MGKKEEWLQHYGSTVIGERGQAVLPIEARKKFGLKPGDRLLVFGSTSGGFERVVLMKSEEVTGLVKHLFDAEQHLKKGPEGMKNLIKENKEEIDKYFKEGGAKGIEKRVKKAVEKVKK